MCIIISIIISSSSGIEITVMHNARKVQLCYMWATNRVATGKGKVLFFFKVREKPGNLDKMVREILNTKKVREKLWNS